MDLSMRARGRSPTGQTPSSMGTTSRMASPPATPAEVQVDESSLEPNYGDSQQSPSTTTLHQNRATTSTAARRPSTGEAQRFDLSEAWETARQQDEISENDARERSMLLRSLDPSTDETAQMNQQRSLDRGESSSRQNMETMPTTGVSTRGSLDPDALRPGSLDPGPQGWNALAAIRSSLRSVGLGTRNTEQVPEDVGRALQGPGERRSPLPLAGACNGTGPLAVRETPQLPVTLPTQDLAQVGSSGLGVRGVEGLLYRDPMSPSGQSRHSGSQLAQLVEGMSQFI